MGKKAKKKARAPARERRNAIHAKNVSEQSSRSEATAEHEAEAAKEKQACVHFTKGVNLDKVLNKIKTSEHIKCGECRDGVHERSKGKGNRGRKGGGSSSDLKSDNKAIWVCLECGHYVCGGVGLPTGSLSHVVRHIRLTRHRLVIQWENPQLRWCFPCNALLPVEKEENGESKDLLSEVVQLIKERSLNTSGSPGTEDLASGSGSITNEIKTKGAISSGIEARDGYVVRGLVNLGNTCFFNSIVQNLFSLDRLREHFLNADLSGGGPLISSLKKLFAETKPEMGSKSVINPRSFFGSICSKAPQFRGYQQHDSHELLRCLLDGLSTEESSLRKKLDASDSDGNSTDQKPTLIDTVFGGEISSTVSCVECGHSSKIYEPFLDLSLPVPTKKPPPKKQQTISRAKKAKLPPKRVPKTPGKVSKVSGCGPADAASKHLDVSLTGNAVVPTDDSTTSGFIAPTSRSTENGPVSETHSAITLENEQTSGITTQTETVFDSFWLDILGQETSQDKTGLCMADENNGVLPASEATGNVLVPGAATNAPVSSSGRRFEGGRDSLMVDSDGGAEPGKMQDDDKSATQSNESTGIAGVCLEINQSDYVGEDPGLGHRSSYVNPWDDEEVPLQVADSEVLYMPYKEESSCTNKTIAEAEASSSFVSCSQDQDMDFDGFGGLFDEPKISEGPVFGPLSRLEVAEAGFMAVSSESDAEEIDDSDSQVSVERCLAHFIKPEILSDDNAWNCENCSKNLKLQRLREKKIAKDASKVGNLNDEGIKENSTSRASHDRENNPSHQICINLENGHKDDLMTESSKCKEKNAMENEVLGNSNILGSKPAAGDSFGIKDHNTTENSTLEREAIDSQLTDGSQAEGNEDEAVNSENVTVKGDATKRVLIKRAPLILTIHLKRFSQDARGRLSKLNGHIVFKEFIDLRSYMDSSGEEKPIYRLAGVVEHSGTMRSGHYVAYVRGGRKSKRNSEKETDQSNSAVWFHVSDSYVRQVSWEEVLRCEAYILFYERIRD